MATGSQGQNYPLDHPIQEYLAPLTNLERTTRVIANGLPAEYSEQEWTLEDVKTYFEKRPEHRRAENGPFICIDLPVKSSPNGWSLPSYLTVMRGGPPFHLASSS